MLIEDACRGVQVDAIADTRRRLIDSGGIIVDSPQVGKYKSINVENSKFGYFLS